MVINVPGGVEFNLDGAPNQIDENELKVSKCTFNLKNLNCTNKDLLRQGNVQRGAILVANSKKIVLSPISGVLQCDDNGLVEIQASEVSETTNESFDLLDNNQPIDVLLRMGLLEKHDPIQIKRIIFSFTNTQPYMAKDKLLYDISKKYIDDAVSTFKKLYSGVKIYAVCADKDVFRQLSEYTELNVIKIKNKYPNDDFNILRHYAFNEALDKGTTGSLYVPTEILPTIMNYVSRRSIPTSSFISIGGNIKNTKLVQVPFYSDVNSIFEKLEPDKNINHYKIVQKGILSGTLVGSNYQTGISVNSKAITFLQAFVSRKLWAFMQPGFFEDSNSKTFVSSFLPLKKNNNNQVHGEKRACVFCGFCENVCPVKIIPFVLYKHVEIDELEDAKQYKIMNCINCGLCTYVCPSKISIAEIIDTGKQLILEEGI